MHLYGRVQGGMQLGVLLQVVFGCCLADLQRLGAWGGMLVGVLFALQGDGAGAFLRD